MERASPNPCGHTLMISHWSWYKGFPVSTVSNSEVPHRALPDITSGPEIRQIFKLRTVWKQIWIFHWMKYCANAALCKSWKMEDAQTKLLHLKDCCHQPAFSSFLEYPQNVNFWKESILNIVNSRVLTRVFIIYHTLYRHYNLRFVYFLLTFWSLFM